MGKKGKKKVGISNRNDVGDDVQIPNNLKDIIEDSDDEYPEIFKHPEELMEIFGSLEEKNLFLI